MQTISSYLLEHSAQQPQDARARFDSISKMIREWLKEKKVPNPEENDGRFESMTEGQEGAFSRVCIEGERGILEETYLSEPTFGGQVFTTRISIIQSANDCIVYSTLGVTNTRTIVAPFSINPRCPSVLRKLVLTFENWALSGDAIEPPTLNKLTGSEEGELLIAEILRPDRRLPMIVVSELEGEPVWSGITNELAYDLTGLAKVFQIDEETSWKLTEGLGKLNSCYLGAVRLYWPPRGPVTGGEVPPNRVWTASSLMSDDVDGAGNKRFRTQMRRTIMNVAALTIEPPRALREIHSSSQKKRLEELEAKATSKSEELEIAKSYLDDNEKLQDEVDQLKAENATLVARAEAAEYALQQRKGGIEPSDEEVQAEEDNTPKKGEIRYYKKTHSKSGYDVLVPVKGCGHSTWQDATKADKAKKGIEKLEGRGDWSKINHCGTCTGGGMWRVKW